MAASIFWRLSSSVADAVTPRMLNNGSPRTFIAPNVSMLITSRSTTAPASLVSQYLMVFGIPPVGYSDIQMDENQLRPLETQRSGTSSGDTRSHTPWTFSANALDHSVWAKKMYR